MTEQWTLDELVGRAAQALAAADVRAPNGRVTQLPDARMIRWYATIGLVDRPSAMRGRTALYGPRHLLQLIAVKRGQAEGRTLAEIQAELAGATDETLRRVAAIPERITTPARDRAVDTVFRLPAGPRRAESFPADRTRFWAQPPAPAEPAPAEPGPAEPVLAEPSAPVGQLAVVRGTNDGANDGADDGANDGADDGANDGADDDGVVLLHGVRLAGAILLLPAQPDEDDLVAIRAAARQLLDVLAERDLLTPTGAPS